MDKNYQQLFAHLSSPQPPNDLFDKIMLRLESEKKLSATKRHFFIFSVIMAISAISFIPVLKMMQNELSQTGFFNFVSLIYSDFGLIVSYWQYYSFSLLESLPTTSLIVLSIVSLIFLQSVKSFFQDVKIIFYQNRFNH